HHAAALPGTTWITKPAGQDPRETPCHSQVAPSNLTGSSSTLFSVDSLDRALVLVVDDEPNILELLAAALRLSGFAVAPAESGAAALAVAKERRPDIVVLDVMLPDVDGFEVARMLRGLYERIPVLFLTARDAVEDRIAGLTVGGDDYVTKPFSLRSEEHTSELQSLA